VSAQRLLRGPIWFAYADGPITCRNHHPILLHNARHHLRGDPVHLLSCSKCPETTYQMGVQSTANNLVSWYALGEEEFMRINNSALTTPLLTMLAIGGFHPMEEL